MGFSDERILVFDGACGTSIQAMDLPDSAWGSRTGCNEYLNLSAPGAVIELHSSFIDAGATVVETNTFGATPIVLAEYDLADRTEEINAAAVRHARAAIGGRGGRYVAGSVGPTTRLPALGHISVAELSAACTRQMRALVEAGVDALMIETCQDLLQAKTAVVTAFEVLEEAGADLPVLVSVTMEKQGTMLVGSDIAAVCAALEPFPIFSLGLNCATGPADMESHLRYLARNWPGRISCLPNQGLPRVVDGRTVYPLSPEEFVRYMRNFIVRDGVSIVGGCCGTTPEHIRLLADACAGLVPGARGVAA